MLRSVFLLGTLGCASSLLSANLVSNGDFSAGDSVAPDYRATPGRISLFVEDLVWNKCGKLEVTEASTNAEGKVTHAANAYVGYDPASKLCGVPVEPDTVYDYVFEMKAGTEDVQRVTVLVKEWFGDDFWHDERTVRDSTVYVKPDAKAWTKQKGKFRVSKDAKRAALMVQIYSSTKWDMPRIRVGSYLLVDNFRIERSKFNLGAPAAVDLSVPVRKAALAASSAATSPVVSDFALISGPVEPACETRVRVTAGATAFTVTADLRDPEGAVDGKGSVWRGDSLEVFFAPDVPGREYTQLAVGPDGAKYTGFGRGKAPTDDGWTAEAKQSAGGWKARLTIPYALLGMKGRPTSGTVIPVNFGRTRFRNLQRTSWAPVKTGFADRAHFGELVIDDFGAAFARRFGTTRALSNAADYAKAVADEEAAALKRKFERLSKLKVAAAPVNPVTDFSVPYLPEEIFDPPTNFAIRACVNELKAFPVAVANLTAAPAQYRVILEAEPVRSFEGYRPDVGAFGLTGLPEGCLTVREAVKYKETDGEPVSLHYDPLPKVNEASVVTVQPKEAGVVWFDFDLRGVKPGVYRGRFSVLPLGETARLEWDKKDLGYSFKGQGVTVPVSLEVLSVELPLDPVRPAAMFIGAQNRQQFDTMWDLGIREFHVSPWFFDFEHDAKAGTWDFTSPGAKFFAVTNTIANHERWAAERGGKATFGLFYGCLGVARNMYLRGRKLDSPEMARLWPEYLGAVKRTMNAAGVEDARYRVEIADEATAADAPAILMAAKLAKERFPTVNTLVTLGCNDFRNPKLIEEIDPYLSTWCFARAYYFSGELLKTVRNILASGKPVSHYSCYTSTTSPTHGYYRLHPWHGERYKLAADELYVFADSSYSLAHGEGSFKTVTYGGIVYRSFGQFIPSVRYMAFREGQTDLKYLEALRRLAGNDPEVKAFLEAAPHEVFAKEQDATLPTKLREKALELIMKRTGR